MAETGTCGGATNDRPSAGIILMVGCWSPTGGGSAGNLMSIVYTLSLDTDLGPSRALAGNERESRAPEADAAAAAAAAASRVGVTLTAVACCCAYGSRITFSEVQRDTELWSGVSTDTGVA